MKKHKIRYVLRNKHTLQIHFKWYYLKQIERGLSKLFDIENYDIISKDTFTGLMDKNGNEIYEGDILETKRKFRTKVWYDDDFARFSVHRRTLRPPIYIIEDSLYEIDEHVNIVGNIHQNKDLL